MRVSWALPEFQELELLEGILSAARSGFTNASNSLDRQWHLLLRRPSSLAAQSPPSYAQACAQSVFAPEKRTTSAGLLPAPLGDSHCRRLTGLAE